jgi:2-iminobutanoate/2-iminopropanoate deaminase
MSMKTIISTDKAPNPVGPYSQAVEADSFIFLSGQIAINPKTNQVFTGPIEEQAKQVMENIQAVLEKAGVGFQNVVKTTIYLINMDDFSAVNEVYARYFREQPPARSTIAVAALPKGVHVEIEMIAKR